MSPALNPPIRTQGDRCLLIDLGNQIDADIGLRCLGLAQALRNASLPGVRDIVPSFTAVAVFFEPHQAHGEDPALWLAKQVRELTGDSTNQMALQSRRIQIPVCYGGEHGPDLAEIAIKMGMTESDVIDAHHGSICRVFMLGFSPGHPYIGIHDERFSLPRREVPRTAVPAGSVGIANRQSTIYPNVLPGGWHIIGATPLKLFDASHTSPTLLMPGDEIEFTPIDAEQFDRIRQDQLSEKGPPL